MLQTDSKQNVPPCGHRHYVYSTEGEHRAQREDTMVDYSKWDNLDSGSDSESESSSSNNNTSQRAQSTATAPNKQNKTNVVPGAASKVKDTGRLQILAQVESLRYHEYPSYVRRFYVGEGLLVSGDQKAAG